MTAGLRIRRSRSLIRAIRTVVVGLVAVAAALAPLRWGTGAVVVAERPLRGLLAAASALCLARPALLAQERGAWLLFGLRFAAHTAGDLLAPVAAAGHSTPVRSLAVVGHLAVCPTGYLAVIALAPGQLLDPPRERRLDGLVAGLGAAAAGATLSALTAAGSSRSAVGLAAAAAGPLLLAVLVATHALLGGRWPTPERALLAAGLALLGVVETAHPWVAPGEPPATGGPFDVLWPVGVALVAFAAWLPPAGERPPRLTGVSRAPIAGARFGHHRSRPLPPVAVDAGVAGAGDAAWRGRLDGPIAAQRPGARRGAAAGPPRPPHRPRQPISAPGRSRPARTSGRVALLVVELEGLGEIHTSLGAQVGDELLRRVGRRLARVVPPGAVPARIEGGQFAVLLRAGPEAAIAAAQRLQLALDEPVRLTDAALRLDASVGSALRPEHATEPQRLLRRARVAAYQARLARTGTELYRPDDDPSGPERARLIEELRIGIDAGQLDSHYQPRCAPGSRAVVAVAAVPCWQHPERGLLRAAEVLPLAERSGLLGALTVELVDRALGQCRLWRAGGLVLPVRVSLSASNVLDFELANVVAARLERHGLPPQALSLEIEESVLATDPSRGREVTARLHELGVPVCVGGFGAGHSVLAQLGELAVDELELDAGLVSRLSVDPVAATIARTAVGLAHSLGLRCAAAGVRTEREVQHLAELGVDVVTGPALGRPMPARTLLRWLAEHPIAQPAGDRAAAASIGDFLG